MSEEINIIPKQNELKTQDGKFILENTDMALLQGYLNIGRFLPTTKEEIIKKYTLEEDITDEEYKEYEELCSEYGEIKVFTTEFSDITFPKTVDTAADIYHYGTKAERYLNSLMATYRKYEDGKISEEAAVQKMAGIIESLKTDALQYRDKAKEAKEEVKKFIDKILKSNEDLGVIKTAFEKKYENDPDVVNYASEVERIQKEIQSLNEKYTHDVIVASTTPSYAWIIPIGLIAGAIVAGIYGSKATGHKDAIENLKKELDRLSKSHSRKMELIADNTLATESISNIIAKAKSAVVSLQKIEGVWDSLQSDLGNFKDIVENDIEKAEMFIKDIGIELAIDSWNLLARTADAYRKTAYISIKEKEEIVEDYKDIVIDIDYKEED